MVKGKGKWLTRGMLATLLWWVYNYRKDSKEHYARMEMLYKMND